MHYLIDGHNLIPKIHGLSLQSIDDELRLVELLQEYCRRSRNQVEVYFDHAPPGQTGQRKYGTVSAHFISQHRSADDAIRQRLGRLGRAGKNWAVVSSDLQVQRAARAAHAQVVPAEKFAGELLAAPGRAAKKEKSAETVLSPEEVAAWMKIFVERSHKPKPGK